jgi:hypothetical protein
VPRAPAVHEGFATASVLLGLLWLGGVGALLAVIFSMISRGNAKRAHRQTSPYSTAGLVLGWIGLAGAVIVWWLLIGIAANPGIGL